MLKIKLMPKGKTHQITFRIVVAEARSKFNGKFTDDLGFYTPQTKVLSVDNKKLEQWLKNGAQLTHGVDKLLHPDKFPAKIKVKPEKVAKIEEVKEEAKEEIKEEAKVEETKSEEVKPEEVKEETKVEETPAA